MTFQTYTHTHTCIQTWGGSLFSVSRMPISGWIAVDGQDVKVVDGIASNIAMPDGTRGIWHARLGRKKKGSEERTGAEDLTAFQLRIQQVLDKARDKTYSSPPPTRRPGDGKGSSPAGAAAVQAMAPPPKRRSSRLGSDLVPLTHREQ